MADELLIESVPELNRPVLIAAFRGWNDGGQGASLAGGYLAKIWRARQFATIDPEGFYDFQATRPQVTLVDGITRRLEWPENAFYHAHAEGIDRDVVILLGIEPNLRWRTFCDLIVGLARNLGVELVVTLGALLADVPHTRPSPVTGSASDPDLVASLGLQQSRYQGPTGIVGVLHDAFRVGGIPSASLWAAVPHYVSLTPSPRAAYALTERLGALLGGTIEIDELDVASRAYAEQVSEAVAADPETQAYVEDLEARSDNLNDDFTVPDGEQIAAELARFLRERENDGDDGPEPPS